MTIRLLPPESGVIRNSELFQASGLKHAQRYALIAADRFPPNFKLSQRASAFYRHEVSLWVDIRAAKSRLSGKDFTAWSAELVQQLNREWGNVPQWITNCLGDDRQEVA